MLGLMVGAADPMLKFPAGTIFTPYANVREISNQNVILTPVTWWMEGAAPCSARLDPLTVLPFHSMNFDNSLAAHRERKRRSKITYVFSAPPSATREIVGKGLSYWSTTYGDDLEAGGRSTGFHIPRSLNHNTGRQC